MTRRYEIVTGARRTNTYRALQVILLGEHVDLHVTVAVLDVIFNEIIVDGAREEVRSGPLDVNRIIRLASDVQDRRGARSRNVRATDYVVRRLAFELPGVRLHPYLVFRVWF